MRLAAIAALLAVGLAAAARADECEASAAQLVALGGEIKGRTKNGFAATLRGAAVELLCGDLASVTLEAATRLPPQDFFTTFAMAATAVVARDWPALRDVAFECQKAALRESTGFRRLDFEGGAMFCEASPRALRMTAAPARNDGR